MTLREELIQVAAVAVSWIEDLDNGVADAGEWTRAILNDVWDERLSQDQTWGPQHHGPNQWLLILMEEVGEAADEVPGWVFLTQAIRSLGEAAKKELESGQQTPSPVST